VTLGAIARETSTIRMATGVTCPLFRTPPAIVAHAAATVETMMPSRIVVVSRAIAPSVTHESVGPGSGSNPPISVMIGLA
jgi:hypothetical protein